MVVTDAAQAVTDLIKNNWTAINTSNITPTIDVIYNFGKRIDLGQGSMVGVYEVVTTQRADGLGTGTRQVLTRVTIDIRTAKSRSHSLELLSEVDRIMNTKIILPDSNYQILDVDQQWQDFSDRMKNLFRWTYDVIMEKKAEARPS